MPLPPIPCKKSKRKELRIVFVGTEPGAESERIGHYYAGTNNSFYQDLHQAGWTEYTYTPQQDKELCEKHGIGFDDVYNDKEALKSRLEQCQPRVVCFNSKEALKRFSDTRIRGNWAGSNASRYASFPWNPIVWALYDSSARARRYQQRRVQLLKKLLKKCSENGY
jgi:G:T/U-mismatch repair DNA glycosylase